MAGKSRILIINPEPEFRQAMAASLIKMGYRVFEATRRADGLPLIYETHPDLILLDITSHPNDGWETLARIRLFTDTAVIVMAERANLPDRKRRRDLQVNRLLVKPFSVKRAVAQVRAQMEHG